MKTTLNYSTQERIYEANDFLNNFDLFKKRLKSMYVYAKEYPNKLNKFLDIVETTKGNKEFKKLCNKQRQYFEKYVLVLSKRLAIKQA